jgi:plasmid maintenance system antidote protein VapI
MNDKLSDQIRRAILDGPMTRYRLATEAQVDHGHLSRFVHGKASLSLDAIDRIGAVLGLRVVRPTKERKGK